MSESAPTTVKNVKKAAPKKAAKKAASPKPSAASNKGLGKVHTKLLLTLSKSKTRAIPKTSKPGELTYKLLAEEAGVAINNLTQYMAKESASGTPYPNSLTSLGYTRVNAYEVVNESGEPGTSPLLYSITEKGLKYIKENKVK